MAKLKPYQVAAAALLGGFPPSEVPTAVAVARGESSYNTTASNFCCSGLWQIHRTAHADKIAAVGGVDKLKDPVVNARLAYQIWKAAGGWCTSGRVGQCNPWQAYGVSNATGSWKAKLAEGAQAYAEVQRRQQAGESLQSMAASSASFVNADWDPKCLVPGYAVAHPDECDLGADDLPIIGDMVDAGSAIAGFAKAVVEFGNKIGSWVSDPQNWIRVAEVIGGGLLVALGLRIAFHKQVMGAARQIASVVVPGGKVAGKAGKVLKTAKVT